MMRSARLVGIATVAMAVLGSGQETPAQAAPRTLQTGFTDQDAFQSPSRDLWLGRAQAVGGTRIRITVGWNGIAPTAPPADQAGNAGWPGYRFEPVDAQVRAVTARGLVPMLNPTAAPAWAAGTGLPPGGNINVWKPDPVAFGQFMRALAERYSGSFPDPLRPGTVLPRVEQFQLWNEPNLAKFLAPQYENGEPFAATRFRELVNAGYVGVKTVQPNATVVAGGLAPYGDPGSHPTRTRPLLFLRQVLCLNSALSAECAAKTMVDAFAIHPYTKNRPSRGAIDADDLTVADLPRMRRAIAAAVAAGTVRASRPPIWVTELHWETSPDPEGISAAVRARYISEAFWRLWRAGVPVVFWYLMRDEDYEVGQQSFESYQSGFFLRSGRRKSDARAFRFPLLVTRTGRRDLDVWFRTPRRGTTTIQVLRRGRWTSVSKVRGLSLYGVSHVKVKRAGTSAVRAKAGTSLSFPWAVR